MLRCAVTRADNITCESSERIQISTQEAADSLRNQLALRSPQYRVQAIYLSISSWDSIPPLLLPASFITNTGQLKSGVKETQTEFSQQTEANTFKYRVACTGGKISVRLVFITYFSSVVPLTSCLLSYRPFVVNATFSTGLVVSSVSWLEFL